MPDPDESFTGPPGQPLPDAPATDYPPDAVPLGVDLAEVEGLAEDMARIQEAALADLGDQPDDGGLPEPHDDQLAAWSDENAAAAAERDAREAMAIGLNELTAALCRAVGLDPGQVTGFRLTVQGGAFPTLEAWHVPPNRSGELTDAWLAPLSERMADTTMAVLPGSAATLPPARDPGDPIGPGYSIPVDMHADATAARILPQLAEAVNGAPVDMDTRDRLTSLAWATSALFHDRVVAARQPIL